MPILTIYTATYNRKKLLCRVYDSLVHQTCKDFIWLIIDDGSTDDTQAEVLTWIEQQDTFEIKYQYKENGGIHTVRDLAYRLCETELIIGVDSDDWLLKDAVQNIVSYWHNYGGQKYAGIISPVVYENGEMVGENFPSLKTATYQEFSYKYRYRGDKSTVIRNDIMQKIPDAPVFSGEKVIGEAYKWIQLPESTPFLLMQSPIKVVEYQEDGYTKQSYKNLYKNPNGFREYYRQHIIWAKYWKPRIKGYVGYIIGSLILRDRHFIWKSPKPFRTIFLVPFGLAGYIYLQLKSVLARRGD